jgi:hypothetical protein
MNKALSEGDKTVLLSDEYLSESGSQGGKIIAEHIVLGSLLCGVLFFIIGLYALLSMLFGLGYPMNTALILGALLVTIIGLLFILGGYSLHRSKHPRTKNEV